MRSCDDDINLFLPILRRIQLSRSIVHPVHLAELTGLLNALNLSGAKEDIARLCTDLHLDLTKILPLLEVSRSLGFVDVHDGDVSLTELGHTFIRSRSREKRKILRKTVSNLEPFSTLMQMLRDDGELERGEVLEVLKECFEPDEDLEKAFNMVINWGRYVQLFAYDQDSEKVTTYRPVHIPEKLSAKTGEQ